MRLLRAFPQLRRVLDKEFTIFTIAEFSRPREDAVECKSKEIQWIKNRLENSQSLQEGIGGRSDSKSDPHPGAVGHKVLGAANYEWE
jgi:hypothetical protein